MAETGKVEWPSDEVIKIAAEMGGEVERQMDEAIRQIYEAKKKGL